MSKRSKTIELTSMPRIITYLKGVTGGRVQSISDALHCMETPDYLWIKEEMGSLFVVPETVRRGTLDDIRLLQSLGYDLQAKCMPKGGGGNALHVAAQHNRQAHAMLLVKMGLKPDKRLWIQGYSALDLALANGNVRLFNKLIETVDTIDAETQKRFLVAALEDGEVVVTPRSKNRDKLKLPAVLRVLQDFGPFSQQELDKALEAAAKGAMPKVFDRLVREGANPSVRVPITIHPSFTGTTSAAVLLLSKAHPTAWERVVREYSQNTDALFPSATRGREDDLDLDRAVRHLESKSLAYKKHNLEAIIAPAVAARVEKTMDETLPDPGETGTFPEASATKRFRL